MTASSTIADGKVVTIHYRLTLDDGSIVSDTEGTEPLAYLHGADNIVPGLEAALAGQAAGARVKASVTPEEGYGDRDPDALEQIPRGAFPQDMELAVGMHLTARHENGSLIPMTVSAITEEQITVDLNHPLAGRTLHFEVAVIEVREATDEERTHGHVHGPGGHHH